jgi:glycosyltransferase involved in cell wall biosynthesis
MIFFIDPQSYSNLAVYDYSLLKYNTTLEIFFYGNSLYSHKKLKKSTFIPLFHYSRYRLSLLKLLSYSISIFRLALKVIRLRPEVIHIEWIRVWFIDYYFLKIIKCFCNVKIVYTAHNVLPHESGETQFYHYKKYYEIVDKIISHTKLSKEELINNFKLPENKITVIPHGILDFELDPEIVENLVNKLRIKLSLKSETVFSVIGNQSYYKGSDIISKVWASTPELHDNPNFKLIIIGKNKNIDFTEIAEIANVYIENRFVSDEEFESILKITDLLLLPYRSISQSGVLLSAINDSIPVIVSNVGGLSEVLSIADIGWNIGKPTCDNLKKTLLTIIKNPSLISLKRNNQTEWKKVHNYYSWNDISIKTFDIYTSLQARE